MNYLNLMNTCHLEKWTTSAFRLVEQYLKAIICNMQSTKKKDSYITFPINSLLIVNIKLAEMQMPTHQVSCNPHYTSTKARCLWT